MLDGKEIETMSRLAESALNGLATGLLLGTTYLLLSGWLCYTPPPQVPCRCGAAPAESTVILPDMVVRS